MICPRCNAMVVRLMPTCPMQKHGAQLATVMTASTHLRQDWLLQVCVQHPITNISPVKPWRKILRRKLQCNGNKPQYSQSQGLDLCKVVFPDGLEAWQQLLQVAMHRHNT